MLTVFYQKETKKTFQKKAQNLSEEEEKSTTRLVSDTETVLNMVVNYIKFFRR